MRVWALPLFGPWALSSQRPVRPVRQFWEHPATDEPTQRCSRNEALVFAKPEPNRLD